MSPALAAVIVDGFLGLAQIGMKSALAIRQAAEQGGELTPEQRAAIDQRIKEARSDMDMLGEELDGLAD